VSITDALPEPIQNEVSELVKVANVLFRGVGTNLVITTQDEYENCAAMAGQFHKFVKDTENTVTERRRKPLAEAALISSEFQRPLEIVRPGLATLNKACTDWIVAEKAREAEENRKREEQRRALALEEAKAAEDAHLAAVDAQRAADAAVVTQTPEAQAIASDAAIAVDEKREVVQAVRADLATVQAPIKSFAPAKGQHSRDKWLARIDNLSEIPRDILEEVFRGKVAGEALQSNLNARANLAKSTTSNIKGVSFYVQPTLVHR